METCPHCNFLVRDDASTCGVCHKSVRADAGSPAWLSQPGQDPSLASRIGPAEATFPVAIVVLCLLGLAMAAAIWVVNLM